MEQKKFYLIQNLESKRYLAADPVRYSVRRKKNAKRFSYSNASRTAKLITLRMGDRHKLVPVKA